LSSLPFALALLSLLIWVYLLALRGGFWRSAERLDRPAAGRDSWPSVSAVVPARMAPTHRPRVAAVAYGAGACFALWAARGGDLWNAFAVAGASGALALWLVFSGAKDAR